MDGLVDSTSETKLDLREHARLESRIRKTLGNRAPDPETQLSLAEAMFDKGDDAEAIRLLRLMIYTDPTNFRAYDRLVETCTKLGRSSEAAETYRQWGLKLSNRSPRPAPAPVEPAATHRSVIDKVAQYYAIRAPEYDETSGYQAQENNAFTAQIKAEIRDVVKDRDAIEIACGTGYWTAVASEAARSVLATDRNPELIEIVRRRTASASNVKCQAADAYSLEGVEGPFTAAYAQFWWSHIPRSLIREFLTALHSKLAPGAPVFFMDSMPYLHRGTRWVDSDGNVVEPRILLNGEKYEVIKNFPTEAELREWLSDFAEDLEYHAYEGPAVWTVRYRARSA